MNITGNVVDALVWDTDGDAFFEIRRGSAACKVDVGSNGLGPDLYVEVFEQHGLDCTVVAARGGPKDYVLSMAAEVSTDGSIDCDNSCNNSWHPEVPKAVSTAPVAAPVPKDWA